jgi:hypothetical protein
MQCHLKRRARRSRRRQATLDTREHNLFPEDSRFFKKVAKVPSEIYNRL